MKTATLTLQSDTTKCSTAPTICHLLCSFNDVSVSDEGRRDDAASDVIMALVCAVYTAPLDPECVHCVHKFYD